jgi:hypothetical protein
MRSWSFFAAAMPGFPSARSCCCIKLERTGILSRITQSQNGDGRACAGNPTAQHLKPVPFCAIHYCPASVKACAHQAPAAESFKQRSRGVREPQDAWHVDKRTAAEEQTWLNRSNGILPAIEANQVVNPIGAVEPRARELWREGGLGTGRLAFAADGRELSPRSACVASPFVARIKTTNAEGSHSRRRALTRRSAAIPQTRKAPPVGLEPTTSRLTAGCSTN